MDKLYTVTFLNSQGEQRVTHIEAEDRKDMVEQLANVHGDVTIMNVSIKTFEVSQ